MTFENIKYEPASCLCGASKPAERKVQTCDEVSGLTFWYERCVDCGLDVLNPRPTAEDIGRFYPNSYYAYQEGYGDNEVGRRFIERLIYQTYYAPSDNRPAAVRYLRPLLFVLLWPLRRWPVLAFPEPELKRVFEIGAAAGSDLMTFRSGGWQAQGCEPSTQACEVAAKRGFDVQCCLAEEAVIASDSYTCVFMNNVFEHLHDPITVLRKVHEGLRSGGYLILVVPNHHGWSARLLAGYWAGYREAPKHIYGYSPVAMKRLLAGQGFQVSYVQHRPAIRWLWTAAASSWLKDRGIHGRMRTWLSKIFALLMLPFSFLASVCRGADFIKVVATKTDLPLETMSTADG